MAKQQRLRLIRGPAALSLSHLRPQISSSLLSLFHFIVKGTESLQSQAGRYKSPEELPFFPENLPPSLLPPSAVHRNCFLCLLSRVMMETMQQTGPPSDLDCLQAISRRIHYGFYVAEVKFRDAPQDYEPAIRAQDIEGLMKLLTFTGCGRDVEYLLRRLD
ncbi:hypothetical protein M0R45_012639 [Rubus argutus]|uniref:chorismate mutase n=1 Tax=Rubus argutus TaxID=59490 RepID=A0AAW1YGV1_RUBAR